MISLPGSSRRSRARPGPDGRAEEAVQVVLAERQDDIARIPRIDLAEVREVEPVADLDPLQPRVLEHLAEKAEVAVHGRRRQALRLSGPAGAVMIWPSVMPRSDALLR